MDSRLRGNDVRRKNGGIMKEYQVVVYQESLIGSLLLGQSKVDHEKLSKYLNDHAR
jgi:hypothetical protein